MILYHGSNLAIRQPRILQQNIGRDFGVAFYTTDIFEQAERWAIRKAKNARLQHQINITPVVSSFAFDIKKANKTLRILEFQEPTLDWLEMIIHCRSNKMYIHGYDIVIGKVANDNVGETVAYVQQGVMRKEDAIERLRFQKINNQIAFCTDAALKLLDFQTYQDLEIES